MSTPQDKVFARLQVDITPAQTSLTTLSDSYKKMVQEISNQPFTLGMQPAKGGDAYIQDASGAIRTLKGQITELQLQFKEGTISAKELYQSVSQLRGTFPDSFNMSTNTGVANDKALREAILNAETQLQKFYDYKLEANRRLEQQQAQIQAENVKQTQLQLAAEQKAQADSIDQQMKQIQAFYQMKLSTAQDSLAKMESLINTETQYFIDNQDKRLQALKQVATYEDAVAAQNAVATRASNPYIGSTSGRAGLGGIGGGLSVIGMGAMMAEFTGISMLQQNIQTGLVQISKDQQGLEQVFGQNVSGQQQLNQVTNQFIGIAQEYGQSVDSVLQAAKQWGRQYHDVATAQALVHSSTLLSIVDNMDMTQSAKSLEAVMNAMGMSVSNAAEAQKSSMSIVDKWSNMAHNASISANDLAAGVQNAAGAAKLAGVNIDQLNALIAAGVRNSGLSGSNVGNMFKTVFANIASDTPKIQKAFETLGISMQDSNGQMKSAYELLTELSPKMDTLDASQKAAILSITRGVQQYSKFAEAISNVNTIQQDYNVSMQSAGAANKYAQEQLYTLSADLQRLKDSIQQMAYDSGSGGLGDVLKGIVVGVTNLIDGLQKLPSAVTIGAAGLAGILMSGRMLTSTMNTLKTTLEGVSNIAKFLKNPVNALNIAWNEMGARVRTTTAALAAKTAATEADTVAMNVEADAARGATVASEEFDAATGGIALAIGVVVTGLSMWAMSAATSAQSTNDLTVNTQQLTQAYQDHQAQVDSLLTQYQKLDQATQGGTVFKDTQQQQDYYNIMNQIAGILPGVTDYTDKNGQAHIQSADAIKQEIAQQQKLIELQSQATTANASNFYQSQIQKLQQYTGEFNRLNQEAKTRINQTTVTNLHTGVTTVLKQVLSPEEIGNIRNQLVQYQTQMDNVTSTIKQENQKLADAFVTLSGTQLNGQSQSILSNMLSSLDTTKLNGDQIKANIQKIVDAVVNLQKTSDNGKVSTDALNQAWSDLSKQMPMVKQATDNVSASTQNASQDTQTLAQQLANATSNAKLLNQAQQELTNQHRLSDTTLQALIKAYPEFANVVGQGDQAMLNFINTNKQQEETMIRSQRAMTETLIAQTKARIQALNDEMQAMQAAALATAAMANNLTSTGLVNVRNPVIQRFTQASAQLPELQSILQQAQADLGQINVAQYTVNTSGYTGSGPKTSATKAKKSPSASSVASAYAAPFQNLSQNDTNALQSYVNQVNNTASSMQDLNTQLSDADNNFKSNFASTANLNAVVSTYNQYISETKSNQAALTAENDKAHQLLNTITSDLNQVNTQFKAGTITAQAHKDALSALDAEWSKLTGTIKSNNSAINADNKSMASATKTVTSEITSMLKQSYTDQQQIEEQRLANIYQPEIDALTAQKNAVDNLMKSLDDQYNIDNAQYKLQQDQTKLNTEMTQNKSYRIVNADGSVSWTYDTTKVQQLQRTVLSDQHNLERSQLQQQSDNIAQQLKNVQDEYNQKKAALDAYWKYKLSTDNLNTEADNAIAKEGLTGALKDLQGYTGQMILLWNAVQQAKVQALGSSDVAASLGGTGFIPSSQQLSGTRTNQYGTYAGTGKSADVAAGDSVYSQMVNGHKVNTVLDSSGKVVDVYKFAKGGMVPLHAGIPGVDSVPALLTPGEGVISAPVWQDMLSSMKMASNTTTNAPIVNINGPLQFPNVVTMEDAQGLMESLIDQVNSAL